MNQLIKVISIAILLSVQACSDAENLVNNLQAYEASAIINGEEWQAEPGEVLFVNEEDSQTGLTTLAILLNGDISFFTFSVVEPEATTYTLEISDGDLPVFGSFFQSVDSQDYYQFESGVFSIDRLEENLVSGTFEGTFRHITNLDVLQITNGVFYLPQGEGWIQP